MKRRELLARTSAISVAGVIAGATAPAPVAAQQKKLNSSSSRFWNQKGFEAPKYSVSRLTHGPENHFFGYYGMSPCRPAFYCRDQAALI